MRPFREFQVQFNRYGGNQITLQGNFPASEPVLQDETGAVAGPATRGAGTIASDAGLENRLTLAVAAGQHLALAIADLAVASTRAAAAGTPPWRRLGFGLFPPWRLGHSLLRLAPAAKLAAFPRQYIAGRGTRENAARAVRSGQQAGQDDQAGRLRRAAVFGRGFRPACGMIGACPPFAAIA